MRADFKSGFVAIIGRPNVGKSTLMNHLIGQKIAITSRKPQTTRNKIQTVYTGEKGQIVFLDTPGIHKAKNKLGEYMVNVAQRTFKDADVILWLVEPTSYIGAGERHIAEQLKNCKLPVILVINKVDTVKRLQDLLTDIESCIISLILYRPPHFGHKIWTLYWTVFLNICRTDRCFTMRIPLQTSLRDKLWQR